VEGYGWWEVPVAQVSTINSVKDSFEKMQNDKKKQKYHL
jgi:TPP-dependent trihydroxycyclohexane-1,2-dione (THcHDO) dehydratase